MLKHYLLIAFRNLKRNKVYSFINIAGLTTGLAGFILVLIYLDHELSYDTWNPQLERVYRISSQTDVEVEEQTPAALAAFLGSALPDVEAATRVQPAGDFEVPLRANDKTIYSGGSIEVDSMFLKVFPYVLKVGDRRTALDKPNAILITGELGRILFGDTDPMGKTIRIFNRFDAEVTGILEVPSSPSHLQISFAWRSPYEKMNTSWENQSYQTYVRTHTALSVKQLESRMNPVFYAGRQPESALSYDEFRRKGHQAGLFADRVSDIHNFPRHGSSSFTTVIVLLVLSFLLLLAGAINFSNLSIASAFRRAREVGIRKAMGSGKRQLLVQFLGETTLQCLISLMLAFLMVIVLLPYFADAFQIQLSILHSGALLSIGWKILVSLLIVVLLAGLYPAVFLSMLNTSKVLKGEYSSGTKGRSFRNVLIVVQFVVAAFFVFGTVVINRQVSFMRSRDKGFSGAQIVRIETSQDIRDKKYDATRSALLRLPGVAEVAKTTEVPGDQFADTSTFVFRHEGREYRFASVKVSSSYFDILGIRLVKGRLFDERYADQHTRSAILNETAARLLTNKDPLGQQVYFDYCDTIPVPVVGVVKDFMVQNFEQQIQPVIYTINNFACLSQSGGGLLVKIKGDQMQGAIAAIQQAWKGIEPELPLRYSFVDDNYAKLFLSYNRIQGVITIFTVVAILISLIGLFAMTAYLTGQRNREIGVRKVLGATVTQLASLLSRDFIMLVLLALAIAAPLAYWATHTWLETFAYRINPHWGLFMLSAIAVLLVALITVAIQTIRAATANPVTVLRSE